MTTYDDYTHRPCKEHNWGFGWKCALPWPHLGPCPVWPKWWNLKGWRKMGMWPRWV